MRRSGKAGFWLLFVGFNLTFFPMHLLGLRGMPRRVYTYPTEMGWGGLNQLASAGAAIMGVALLIYAINIVISLRRGAVAGTEPMGRGRRWSGRRLRRRRRTTSTRGPTVAGREPLWHPDPEQPVVVGLATDRREVLVTRVLDAEPDHKYENPTPSIWPFITAICVSGLFIGSIFTPWAVVWGAIPSLRRDGVLVLAGQGVFAARTGSAARSRRTDAAGAGAVSRPVINVAPLPDFGFGHRALVWWATLGVIAIEGAMFALMIANYLYLKGRNSQWPPGAHSPALSVRHAEYRHPSRPRWCRMRSQRRRRKQFDLRRTQLWMVVCIAFAIAFNIVRVFEFRSLNVWWDTNAYGSVVWTLLGLHTTHLVTDLLDTLVLAVVMFTGPIEQKRFSDVSENAFYWLFVVLAWLPIYALLYITPRVA